MRQTRNGPRVTAQDLQNRALLARLAAAEEALREANEFIGELHQQLNRANAAAVRVARAAALANLLRRGAA